MAQLPRRTAAKEDIRDAFPKIRIRAPTAVMSVAPQKGFSRLLPYNEQSCGWVLACMFDLEQYNHWS